MIYRLYVVQAVAENPAPTGDHDSLLYCQFTMPDFWFNTCVDKGYLMRVMSCEIDAMSQAIAELGADLRTVRWEGHITMPIDSEEYADAD